MQATSPSRPSTAPAGTTTHLSSSLSTVTTLTAELQQTQVEGRNDIFIEGPFLLPQLAIDQQLGIVKFQHALMQHFLAFDTTNVFKSDT